MIRRAESLCGGRKGALALLALTLLGLGLRLDFAVRAPQRPIDDARGYARIAAALYEEGAYSQGPEGRRLGLQPAENYSPGLPLLAAAVYELGGGVNETAARIVLALIAAAAVPLSFGLGRRLGGSAAGLVAAAPMAIYPALLEYTGMLTTEPLATTLLAAALLAFLRACDGGSPWRFALAGALTGALAMVRPEYLALFALLPALGALKLARSRGWRAALGPAALTALAACLVVAPWTVRNAIALDRFVPLSTGGGQALFEGSYRPSGGDPQRVMAEVLARNPGIRRELQSRPGPIYLDQVVAALATRRHPGEDTDAALAQMGRSAYLDQLRDDPFGLAGYLAGKTWRVWTVSTRQVMNGPLWRLFHLLLVAAALAGLAIGLARRSFAALTMGAVAVLVTAIQAVYVASPRRTLVLLPLICALAGLCAVWLAGRLRERRAISLPR
ncbi:MAG: glycosyltransferase family 39 protein [Solirubrobacterales bacterium]